MRHKLANGALRALRVLSPDPLLLAIGLTAVVFLWVALATPVTPLGLISVWISDDGIWSLLAFTTQMALILVTGHAVASAPASRRLITWLARWPRTGAQALWLVATTAMVTGLLNWGLGLMAGAFLARGVGEEMRRPDAIYHVKYPLVCAAGYLGMLVWHGGLSGTAPLMTTTETHVRQILPQHTSPLSFTDTVFGFPNLLITGGMVVWVPLLVAWIGTQRGWLGGNSGSVAKTLEVPATPPPTIAHPGSREPQEGGLAESKLLAWLAAAVLLLGAVLWFDAHGWDTLDPNRLNVLFAALGLALHGSIDRYRQAFQDATQGVSGILLQFPLYAGILGMLRTSGLGTSFATTFASWAGPQSFPTLTMLSAALLNLFVPSGGGQWAIQGPVTIAAAQRLSVDPALSVMAVAYGDQLTNMLQPFWALPLLAITGVKAHRLLVYTGAVMVPATIWYIGWLLYFAR